MVLRWSSYTRWSKINNEIKNTNDEIIINGFGIGFKNGRKRKLKDGFQMK